MARRKKQEREIAVGKTEIALEWAENELMIQVLKELARTPLSTIDRFRQEVPGMLEDRAIHAHELMPRVSQLLKEIYQRDEVAFAHFEKEAVSAEQELYRRLERLTEIRERARVVHALVRSMFAPAVASHDPRAAGNANYYGIDYCDKCGKSLEDRQWLVGLCRACEQQK